MKPYPPLGILYASAHLKQMGFSVGVYDTTFSDLASFREYLRREAPAVVGLYCNLTTRGQVLEMVKLCRKAGCLTVLGGPEPASYVPEYLANGADVVVVGEGEVTLEELLPHLLRDGVSQLDHIAGLAYKDERGRSSAPQLARTSRIWTLSPYRTGKRSILRNTLKYGADTMEWVRSPSSPPGDAPIPVPGAATASSVTATAPARLSTLPTRWNGSSRISSRSALVCR